MPAVGISNNLYFFYLVTWRHLLSGFLLGALVKVLRLPFLPKIP
jgi:hypothetical protein